MIVFSNYINGVSCHDNINIIEKWIIIKKNDLKVSEYKTEKGAIFFENLAQWNGIRGWSSFGISECWGKGCGIFEGCKYLSTVKSTVWYGMVWYGMVWYMYMYVYW